MFDQYRNYEKMFILMVLMHSENLEDAERCVSEFEKLAWLNKDSPEVQAGFMMNVNYAKSHLEVI